MNDLLPNGIDIPTLALGRGLIQMMIGGLLLYMAARDQRASGARLWAFGFFFNGVSLFVFPLNVPESWEQIRTTINHLTLGTSSVFLLAGFWAFGQHRRHLWLLALFIAIPAFSLIAFEGVWPNTRLRILTTASGQALFLAALLWTLRRAPRQELSRIYRVLRYVTGGYLLIVIWSYASVADLLPTTARVEAGYHRTLFSIASLLFMLTLAVACLALQFAMLAARHADLARIDWLTGLLNRRGFFHAIAERSALGMTAPGPAAVIMLDIDHFKQVNDRHGHAAGDLVLTAIGDILREETCASHLVARTGGEEFCLVLPGAELTQATALAERIRTRCAERRIDLKPDEPIPFTVSVGLSLSLADPSLEGAMAQADQAMYQAKRRGRNQVQVHGEVS